MCFCYFVDGTSTLPTRSLRKDVWKNVWQLFVDQPTWMVHISGKLVGKYTNHMDQPWSPPPRVAVMITEPPIIKVFAAGVWMEVPVFLVPSWLATWRFQILFGRMGRFIYLKEWLVILLLRWWFQSFLLYFQTSDCLFALWKIANFDRHFFQRVESTK